MDIDLLNSHIANGIVNRQRHPTLPLTILNYSQRCQYDRLWDDVTLQCRGLVMLDDQIIARPFRKFFNDTEHAEGEIPWHLPSEVTEKLDGSLLIVFHFDGQWHYATRGSFTSTQSVRGKEIFQANYAEEMLDPARTYLFEVIYPENRIVVNYGDRADTILLGMIEPKSGSEFVEQHGELTCVRRLPLEADIRELRTIITDDQEGYVVRFENGFRIKVKGQRYIELHRLLTGVSSRSIWEALSGQKSLDEMLEVIPDEFGDWVRREQDRQLRQYSELCCRVQDAYAATSDLPTRKEQALTILADYREIAGAVFAKLDGKDASQVLWKLLYPEFRRPEIAERIEA